ncbi:hypothetical protein DITRI_Ditri18aG0118100 [Diplodiscus trichospermus]
MREVSLGFCLIFIASSMELASAMVVWNPFSISFPDLPAKFARGANNKVCGAVELADPLDACTSLPPRNYSGSDKTDPIKFALIIRGNCSFEEKIRNGQSVGFSAANVYDDKDRGNLVYMTVNPKGIKVLAVFVSKSAGEFLKDNAKGEKGECCIYPLLYGKAWTVFALSFPLAVMAAFLVIVFIATRSLSDWRRRSSVKTVDTKMVEALPRVSFSSARLSQCSTGETCAICLEDYKDGEILKVLPCQHDFHSSCVDSWLTKWGTFCPVCKLDMTPKIAYSEVIILPTACEGHPFQKFVSGHLPLQRVDLMFGMMLMCPPLGKKGRKSRKTYNSKMLVVIRTVAAEIGAVTLKTPEYMILESRIGICGFELLVQFDSIFNRENQGKQPQDLRNNGRKPAKPKHIKSELAFVMGSLDKSSGSEVVTIDVTEAKSLLQSGYCYIDVRTVEECKEGHVDTEKILNIPYMFNTPDGRVKNSGFLKEVSSLCKEDDGLVVGCQSGVRSLYATADLLTIGFKNVSNMGGGYLAWVENGLPVKAEPAEVEVKPNEEL